MDLLLSLLIWFIIVAGLVGIIKIAAPYFEVPPPVTKVVLLVIGVVALIVLLILVWPLLTHPGSMRIGN